VSLFFGVFQQGMGLFSPGGVSYGITKNNDEVE
jgi:hypothetical protein